MGGRRSRTCGRIGILDARWPAAPARRSNQANSTSFSHGWGAAGINGILESLLGITVTGAGASTVQIAPPATGLTTAAGTEWTERGPVTVNWRHVGHTFTLDVTAPDNVSLDIVLPTTARAHYATGGAGDPQLVQVSGGTAHSTAGSEPATSPSSADPVIPIGDSSIPDRRPVYRRRGWSS